MPSKYEVLGFIPSTKQKRRRKQTGQRGGKKKDREKEKQKQLINFLGQLKQRLEYLLYNISK